MAVITISKAKAKAGMLEIFRHIEETGEEVIVADRGRPALRIQSVEARRGVDAVFKALREAGVHHAEDAEAPTVDEWPLA